MVNKTVSKLNTT